MKRKKHNESIERERGIIFPELTAIAELPTPILPGPAKVKILEMRFLAGVELWNDADFGVRRDMETGADELSRRKLAENKTFEMEG